MVQPNHPSFIHPLPMPPVSPVVVPVQDYPSFWWDRAGPSFPPPHSHPRTHRFTTQENMDRGHTQSPLYDTIQSSLRMIEPTSMMAIFLLKI
ncbi:AMME syndrome candidate 1 protein like protein [Vespula squamosa]|uniref:AMME syndrome candidate 1 protein like protein n=1 Tax=Vespula squamosa TaxID=30214 RepID=A0ABD2C7C8_VESSQ